jgi:REP element-mobilizing transposase RayT
VPRRRRDECSNGIHHVVAKGNGGGLIIHDDDDRHSLVLRLERAALHCEWSCLAYCVMDTHVHVIVRTPQPNLGRGMQRFLSQYAQRFNRRYQREGHLFRGRFYSRLIAPTEHLEAAITYVLMNPVRAGMVTRADLWRWSSCASTLGLTAPPAFLDVPAALDCLSADPDAARARLEDAIRAASERDRLIPAS